MKIARIIRVGMCFGIGIASAAEPGKTLSIASAPTDWNSALPLIHRQSRVLIRDEPAVTRLRWWAEPIPPLEKGALADAAALHQFVGKISNPTATPAAPDPNCAPEPGAIDAELVWTIAAPVAGPRTWQAFATDQTPLATITGFSLRDGTTTHLRRAFTVPEIDAAFVTVRADQPGALNLTAALTGPDFGPASIVDRRHLLVHSIPPTNGWATLSILPFESDVRPAKETPEADTAGSRIELPGEGEVLIIFRRGNGTSGADPVKFLATLGERFDPGHAFPSPVKLRDGLLAVLEDLEP